ncbi:MAG: hypothetical protein NZ920_02950 [Aigarchaeota archaeon]|nr:hypothetical protein [Aigarchaeota archaeon]MDW8092419.1 hypothetical protein [Nitrososphaerota archaeon]
MRKYIMGATLVKALLIGISAYKTMLIGIKENFLAGHNVSVDLVRSVEREAQLIEKWGKAFSPGHEYVYTQIGSEDREFLRHVAESTLKMVEVINERVKSKSPDIQMRQLEDLERALRDALESVHLEVRSVQGVQS